MVLVVDVVDIILKISFGLTFIIHEINIPAPPFADPDSAFNRFANQLIAFRHRSSCQSGHWSNYTTRGGFDVCCQFCVKNTFRLDREGNWAICVCLDCCVGAAHLRSRAVHLAAGSVETMMEHLYR